MHYLIYRDDLIKSLPVDWPTTVLAIEEAPAVDAVEVVKCLERIHYGMGACLKIYDDCAASRYAWQERKPDDFCSYGERKEGDDNG